MAGCVSNVMCTVDLVKSAQQRRPKWAVGAPSAALGHPCSPQKPVELYSSDCGNANFPARPSPAVMHDSGRVPPSHPPEHLTLAAAVVGHTCSPSPSQVGVGHVVVPKCQWALGDREEKKTHTARFDGTRSTPLGEGGGVITCVTRGAMGRGGGGGRGNALPQLAHRGLACFLVYRAVIIPKCDYSANQAQIAEILEKSNCAIPIIPK